ncbi:MAG: hypothetical protein DMD80_26280 [Candidatus Rokuibacteriota bacterium]|nr:MAG: hypothetical protein DMD80_26280 [Candidatus Rokubacteria bacterium]
MGEPVGEAVEGDDRARRDLPVEGEVQRQVQRRPQQVRPEPEGSGPPRGEAEQREELVRVQQEHGVPRAAFDVVAQERVGRQRAIALEEDVVGDVVQVDEESAGRDGSGGRPRPGEGRGAGTGDGGGDEVASRAHAPILTQRACRHAKSLFGGRRRAPDAQRRARNGTATSGPTTRAIYSPSGAISQRRRRVSGYVPVAIFAALIVGFGVVSLAIAWLLRPSRPDIVKLMNYECGAEPIGPAWVRFPVGFYLVALVFIVFDALAVFLVPWLLVLKPLGLPAFWGMAGFVGIIALGWLYAYREGVLEWK